MKASSRLLRISVVAVIGIWVMNSASLGQMPSGIMPDQYIVVLNPGISAAAVASTHGLSRSFTYRAVINGFAARIPSGRLRTVQNDARVSKVIPDRYIYAYGAPPGKGGGGGGSKEQVVPEGVKRIGASPGAVAYTGAGVGIAIVDTGVDYNHSDLQPLGSAQFSAFGGSAQDDNRHGTHVGGIVAARNNSIDVVGVAPDATLFGVKVLNSSGSGSDSTVMAGLDWVALNADSVSPPIRVVNMSLGRPGTLDDNTALRESVQTLTNVLGISVVVAAGNDCDLEVSQQVPATYPEVMAIASTPALDGSNKCSFLSSPIQADTASWFTTDGDYVPPPVGDGIGITISAPGEDKENVGRNCFISSVGILSTNLGGGTTRLYGTSMSSPHVAGAVALMWQKAMATNSVLDPEMARMYISMGADLVGQAPLNNPANCYSFDGELEGTLDAPGALGLVP